jgi:hypothetical protein
LQKYRPRDRSLNYSGHVDRKLDDLYDRQAGELDRKRIAAARFGGNCWRPRHSDIWGTDHRTTTDEGCITQPLRGPDLATSGWTGNKRAGRAAASFSATGA